MSRSSFERGVPAAIARLRESVGRVPDEEAWSEFEKYTRELLDLATWRSLQNAGARWTIADPARRWSDGLALPSSESMGAGESGIGYRYWSDPHCPVCGTPIADAALEPVGARPEQDGVFASAGCACGARWLEGFHLVDLSGCPWDGVPPIDEMASYREEPFCGSCSRPRVERRRARRETEGRGDCPSVRQDAACLDCGEAWVEVYGLAGVRVWKASWDVG